MFVSILWERCRVSLAWGHVDSLAKSFVWENWELEETHSMMPTHGFMVLGVSKVRGEVFKSSYGGRLATDGGGIFTGRS